MAGYSRAVKAGNIIHISGTTSGTATGAVLGGASAHDQTVHILEKIDQALSAFGAKRSDVVRTRIYLKCIGDWRDVGKAHALFFLDAPPATTIVEASGFIDPAMLVEIEAEAHLGEARVEDRERRAADRTHEIGALAGPDEVPER